MSDRQPRGAMRPRTYTGRIPIPEQFHCEAERRSRRFRIDLEYEDIGEELPTLRKKAYDLYGAVARDTCEAKTLTTADLPEGEPTAGLRAAIDKAREILPRMPGERLGKLQLDSRSQPMLNLEPVETREDSWIRPWPGGAMPAMDGMDGEMIAALVAEYGKHGSRYKG